MSSNNGNPSAPDRTLQPSSDCIPVERFGEPWTPPEEAHLAGCAHCQGELALWEAFEASTPSDDEGAAVQWIVAELGRRAAGNVPAVREPAWWQVKHPRVAAMAATIALAAVVGYGLWNPEPAVRVRQDAPMAYRSVQVQAVAPIGDIAAAPGALEWTPFKGAVSYDVVLMEVDRASLWQARTASTRVEIPAGVVEQLVPGKNVLWEVTARDAAGALVADSGPQRFRVAVAAGLLHKP